MRSSGFRLLCFALLFTLSLGVNRASAQFDTATVVGNRARRIRCRGAGRQSHAHPTPPRGCRRRGNTTSDGNYEFRGRPALASTLVTAEKSGFSIALADNVQVQVAARMRVRSPDGRRPGYRTHRCHGPPRRSSRPTPASAARSSPSTQIQELPLNGREYSSLRLVDDRGSVNRR